MARLVGRDRLLPAHQRLDAGSNAAQSAGPAVSGAVIAWLGAPISLLLAAGAHLVSAIVLSTLPADERLPRRSHGLGRAIVSGLRFVHRHPRLGPFARWTHVWFLCNGAAMTLLVPLVLIELEAGPAGLGLAIGVLSCATLVGTALAGLLGDAIGFGPALAIVCAGFAVAAIGMAASPLARGRTAR